jgi:hypothetical protein
MYAVAAGPHLIDLLGDDGERLAAAGAKTLASPAEVVRVDRVRLLPPIPRPPAVRDFMTFRQHIEVIRKAQGLELPRQFFEMPVFYFTNPHALVGAHDPVPMPPGCQNLDFSVRSASSSDATAKTSTRRTPPTTSSATACSTTGAPATCSETRWRCGSAPPRARTPRPPSARGS